MVFIDETWTKTNMTRLHGWAQTRRQSPARALEDGDVPGRLAQRPHRSALPLRRTQNDERFLAYVEQFLFPTLGRNDIVVLDNLGSHKRKAMRRAIRAAGARLLFLPKYSPDLNPIEQVCAKLNGLVRKLTPRSLDAVSGAVANALNAFPPHECAAYLRNARNAYA